MRTANIVSRPSVGAAPAVSITVAIRATSMITMESVKISVPRGSPRSSARCSACSTTPKAHHIMIASSQVKNAADLLIDPRSLSQAPPKRRKAIMVTQAADNRADVSASCLIICNLLYTVDYRCGRNDI
jgi:hypothetical protein